nr:MAG TPA: hypothetical protein [Bacteriophage sp.]
MRKGLCIVFTLFWCYNIPTSHILIKEQQYHNGYCHKYMTFDFQNISRKREIYDKFFKFFSK